METVRRSRVYSNEAKSQCCYHTHTHKEIFLGLFQATFLDLIALPSTSNFNA